MADDRRHRQGPTTTAAWRLWPLVAIAAGLAAFFALGLDRFLTFEALSHHRGELIAWRDGNYGLTAICFVAGYAAMVALSVPGAVWLTLAGGFLFGPATGTLLVVVGASLGAVAVFLAARLAFGDYLRARAGPAIRRMEKGFREDAFSYLLVLRLIPLFPFWLVNLVPAFLGVPLRTYILATVIGIVPGSFVYCGVGNGLGELVEAGRAPDLGIIFEPAVLLPILGLAALSLLPVAYKQYKRRRG